MKSRGFMRAFLLFAGVILLTAGVAVGFGYLMSHNTDRGIADREDKALGLEKPVGDLVRKSILAARIVREKVVQATMTAILDRLRSGMEPDPYTPMIIVADSGRINAYSLPGGLIVVDCSLIAISYNPEEVAAVIAHELSHMAHADSWDALRISIGTSLALAALGGEEAVRMARNLIREAAFLGFSREIETRADKEGIGNLAKVGISPSHFADALMKLKAATEEGEDYPEILSSHPDIDGRVELANQAGSGFEGKEIRLEIDWPAVKKTLPSVLHD